MARGKQETKPPERTRLLVPLEEARERVRVQLDRGEAVPNRSINENDEARRCDAGDTVSLYETGITPRYQRHVRPTPAVLPKPHRPAHSARTR